MGTLLEKNTQKYKESSPRRVTLVTLPTQIPFGWLLSTWPGKCRATLLPTCSLPVDVMPHVFFRAFAPLPRSVGLLPHWMSFGWNSKALTAFLGRPAERKQCEIAQTPQLKDKPG